VQVSADTARHSGTSALIAFALLNGLRGARTNWHPACTDSINLTRSLSGNAVIIPVIGLKIGVCARQKSSKIRKVRATSVVVVVISSKPSRANNELSASRLESPVPVLVRPPGAFARLKRGAGPRPRALENLISAGRERDRSCLDRVWPSLRLGAALSAH
jgi:hypothetical protein